MNKSSSDLAKEMISSGDLLDRLNELIQIPTDSRSRQNRVELLRYCNLGLGPLLAQLGLDWSLCDNPIADAPPLLLGQRIENPSFPTILTYGHGDTVPLQAQEWMPGLRPDRITIRNDKIYGRGVADNKGQHLINLMALLAVIKSKKTLGFNLKLLVEMGEEIGSPGLYQFCQQNRSQLSADVLIASDGPRLMQEVPTVFLGSRGGLNFVLKITLREGAHHSGNWGGALRDPTIRLAHALATITDPTGRILIADWLPTSLTPEVRQQIAQLPQIASTEFAIDPAWGEPGLSVNEKLFGWNSFAVLDVISGMPDQPVNAIQPSARAHCQLRFVVGTEPDKILPALRRHLDIAGFADIEISNENSLAFPASRTDASDPWVQRILGILSNHGTKPVHLLPNLAGSLPNTCFSDVLGLPTIWVPHSYRECSQHAPNEHTPLALFHECLSLMTDLFDQLGTAQ